MGSSRARRPPAPPAADRARSLTRRGGRAALVGTGGPGPVVPLVHHVRADGSALLLLDDTAPVLPEVAGAGPAGLPAMLELTDLAPVDLRERVRGLLWVTGWVRAPGPAEARRDALCLADRRPHPRLLDLGAGTSLVRLEAGSVVLADAEGTAALSPVELAAGRPDPFAGQEGDWLTHLEQAHPDVLGALARHLPPTLRPGRGTRVRPLGVDRCGMRLRIESDAGDHDARLAWQAEATTADELREQLRLLVGCPLPGAATAVTRGIDGSDRPRT